MCRKTVYYNTYADGSEDVTERVDTCRPGKMCARPERRECHRQLRFAKVHTSSPFLDSPASLSDRRPSPYTTDFLELPPTPRSKSPSPSRKHESGVYINGEKVASIHSPRRDKRRNHVVVHAPEPPSPIRPAAPAFKRSSTMPTDYVVIENEAGRGRGRPSRTTRRNEQRRSSSRDVLIGGGALRVPADDDEGSSRRSASPRPTHYREHTRTPRGYEFVDERRRSHSRRASMAGAYMTPPPTSAAVAAARKEVHFTADPVSACIREQNERIARRPKVVYQEVKGILKKDLPTTGVAKDGYDDLRRAVGKMDIHPSGRYAGDDARYWDRLRDRFEEPRERRRKSRVYYPGEGVYKYM